MCMTEVVKRRQLTTLIKKRKQRSHHSLSTDKMETKRRHIYPIAHHVVIQCKTCNTDFLKKQVDGVAL
jgi:hypothetical protein